MARIKTGIPVVKEIQEGETERRYIPGTGMVTYTRYNNQLYSSKSYPSSVPPIIDKKTRGTINSTSFITQNISTGELELDFSSLHAGTIANGDSILFLDSSASNIVKKEALSDVAALFAGAGMTATSSVINVIGGTGITANANEITTTDSEIVHDNLSGFVGNEHIDHSGVTLTAGVGLSGGGTIAASRTFTLDISEFSDVTPADGDKLLTLDSDGANEQLTTIASLATLFAGTGLSAASSVLSVDINELTTETSIVDADYIAMYDTDGSHSGKITFENFEDAIFSSVGGDIAIAEDGDATIQADSVEGTMLNTNAADTSTLELSSDTLSVLKVPNALTAGAGISAGGTFDGAAARTFALDINELTAEVIATGDTIPFNDAGDNGQHKESIDDLFKIGPALVTEANIDQASDYILFLDGGATGEAKKESVPHFVDAINGTGLDAGSGLLSVSAAQTTITSIINSGMTTIGTAADQEYIKFDTSNEINTIINDTERLSVTSAGVDVTGAMTVSTSVDITGSAGLILENDETITNSTDGTVLINGIVAAGTGSAPGVFQSNGNFDVTLQTGNSTTGSITITDGANGNISITPNGSGIISLGGNMTIPDAGTIGSASDTDAISISSAGLVNVSQTATVGTSTAAGDMSDLLSTDQKTFLGDLLDGTDDKIDFGGNNGDGGATLIDTDTEANHGFTASNATFEHRSSTYGNLVNTASAQGYVSLPLATIADRTYECTFDVYGGGTSNIEVCLSTSTSWNTGAESGERSENTGHSLVHNFKADDTSSFLIIRNVSSTSGHAGRIDNIVVREAAKWTGGEIGSPSYVSGFAGAGWKIDKDATADNEFDITVDNMFIRGRLSVYELLIQQIRATNGAVFISSAAKVESTSGLSATDAVGDITFEDPSGHGICPFATNDLIMMQRVVPGSLVAGNSTAGSTDVIKKLVYKVTAVDGATATVTGLPGGTDIGFTNNTFPSKGDDFVRIGNTGTTSRQGIIYLTSDDTNAPYIDIKSGVNSYANWHATSTTKVRLGNLAGITDSDMNGGSELSGYGLYATGDVHIKGALVSGSLANASTTATTNQGFYADSTGNLLLKGDDNDTNYIKFDADAGNGALQIKTGNFSVDSSGDCTMAGTVTASAGAVADWDIVSNNIYNLSSGTPTLSPNTGIVMSTNLGVDNHKPVINVYDGTTINAALGNFANNKYGIYAIEGDIGGWTINADGIYKLDSGSPGSSPQTGITIEHDGGTNSLPFVGVYSSGSLITALGNYADGKGGIYAIQGEIGSWTIGSTTIASGTNVILDQGNNKITLGNGALALEYNSGTPVIRSATNYSSGDGFFLSTASTNNFRVGDAGASRLQFTGTNVEIYNSSNAKLVSIGATNTIAGWTLNTSDFYKDNNGYIGITTTGHNDVGGSSVAAFFAGGTGSTGADAAISFASDGKIRGNGTYVKQSGGSAVDYLITASRIFGNGSDGALTISSSSQTTSTWISSGVLQRDVYATNLTINASITVKSGGFRIFVRDTFTIGGSGVVISNNGDSGANGSAGATDTSGGAGAGGTSSGTGDNTGAGGSSGSLLGGVRGGNGGAGGVGAIYDPPSGSRIAGDGNAGTAITTQNSVKAYSNSAGSAGGSGDGSLSGAGQSPGGTAAAGASSAVAGNVSVLDADLTYVIAMRDVFSTNTTGLCPPLYPATGASGGGGGGGGGLDNNDDPGAGGGGGGQGGGSGGHIMICARIIAGTQSNLTLQANGGAGGTGGNGGTISGGENGGRGAGGNGGDGGCVTVISGTDPASITVSVAGGAAGSNASGGGNTGIGTPAGGTAGTTIKIQC